MIESASLIIGVLITSVLLTEVLRKYAHKKSIFDVPNSRSSHSEVTPRGGGAAIVVTFLLSLSLSYFFGNIAIIPYITLMGAGGLVSAIGFWDDHNPVSARVRIVFHLLASIWAVSWLGGIKFLDLGFGQIYLGWVGIVVVILLIAWLINLYNFMDGIDGIASVETIFVALSAALFLYFGNEPNTAYCLCLLAASCAGFLYWNWPPAKIFMGDVASGFLGIILGVFILSTVNDNTLSLWTWSILLGVFIVDATYTLLKRMYHSERWYEAHRCHAYQFAAEKSGSHRFVTLAVLALNIIWLFPLAWMSVLYPNFGFAILLIAYIPLLALAIFVGAGKRPELNKFVRG